MRAATAVPKTIDEYIAGFPPAVRAILERIRRVVHDAAPGAEETISYRMPALRLEGIVLYFAAFQGHIGVFPPVAGDTRLERALRPYAGPKGNLRFPLDRPIPYDLIRRAAALRVAQNLAKAAAKGGRRATPAAKRSRRAIPAAKRGGARR